MSSFLILFFLSSCSTPGKASNRTLKRAGFAPQYQYEPLEEGIVKTLLKQPLSWETTALEGSVQYTRAFLFFKKYFDTPPITKVSGEKTSITAKKGKAQYILTRTEVNRSSVFYEIKVNYNDNNLPKSQREKVELLLSANLARFLREGALELRLMESPVEYIHYLKKDH